MEALIKNIQLALISTILIITMCLAFSAPKASAGSLFSGAKKEACAGSALATSSGPDCTADDANDLSHTIQQGINVVTIIVGIIAVIMIIIGGIRFIVSDGDSGKVTTARNTIMYALIGLILVAFAQVIVKFVLLKI